MTISDSYRMMNNYRINDIPKVDYHKADQVKPEPEKQNTAQPISIEPVAENSASKNTDPNKVSLTFNRNESFGYIGRDKDISNMDMQKAISVMRQESALQDYQYFVGSSRNVFNSEDGSVIAK